MRQRLLLLIIAALLPLVVVIGALSFLSVTQQRSSMRDAAVGYAEQILKSVDRELRAQSTLLQVLARSPTLDASQEGLAQFRDVASRFVDQAQDWNRVILSDIKRGQIVNTGAPLGAPLPGVVDTDGYHRALASSGVIVTDLTGPGAQAPKGPPSIALRTAAPLKDSQGLVLTVLIRPEAFERAITDAQIKPTWRPFLIDGADRVISAPRVSGATGQRAGQAAIDARRSGSSGVYSGRAWNGEPVITAFIKSPATGWSAHISIPSAEYNAPLRRSATLIGALSVLALALFALFACFARRELLAMRAESEAFSHASRMEALGRMTGGIAHDFNNLLMVVSTGADMLRKRNLDRGAERFVSAIQHAAERGARLTRDLATFARARGGDVTTIEAGLRIASIKTLLRQSVTDNIMIEYRIPEGPHYIEVDPVEFDLAILNIVSNARDAMPDGGRIVIAIEDDVRFPDSANRKGLRLSIADTGSGIKAEDLPHVFEPFFTTKAIGKGTGLGLSHVYGFAQAHGGRADASSIIGKGTTISIYLPKAEPAAALPPQERLPVDESWRADGLEAIVVDDNDDVRVLTGEVLADLGFKVRYASNASEALALCEASADLLVSDIVMPGAMDGTALGRIVRQRWPDMQIVLMTGYSEASNAAAASGMRVIQKPFTRAALLAAINPGRFELCARRPRTNA